LNFFELLKTGDQYLKVWPKQSCLYSLFVDSKMVCYTQLLIKLFPLFIILISSLYIFWPDYFGWPNTATFLLFLIGLPVHCFLWLGKRSQQLLSHSTQKKQLESLRFIDLAKLLNKGFKQAGDDFLYQNELI